MALGLSLCLFLKTEIGACCAFFSLDSMISLFVAKSNFLDSRIRSPSAIEITPVCLKFYEVSSRH